MTNLIKPIVSDIIAPNGKITGIKYNYVSPALNNTNSDKKIQLNGIFTINKFVDDAHAEAWKAGDPDALPYEVIEAQNGGLNSGITELWNILIGSSSNYFNHTNTRIGVGDSSTAFNATQTDLVASTNKTYAAADATYPVVSGQTLTVQATFGTSAANYVWNEMVIKNNASSICLDRVVANFGTKASGSSWVAQAVITMS